MFGNISAKIDLNTVRSKSNQEQSCACNIQVLSIQVLVEIPKSAFRWTELERPKWVFDRTRQSLYVLYVVLWDVNYSVKSQKHWLEIISEYGLLWTMIK